MIQSVVDKEEILHGINPDKIESLMIFRKIEWYIHGIVFKQDNIVKKGSGSYNPVYPRASVRRKADCNRRWL